MKILIIDDNPDVLKLASYVLEAARAVEVRIAESGMTAIEILADWPAQLIMLDTLMPVMNGFQTLEAIQQWWPNIPVVFFTTEASEEYLKMYHKAGAVGAIHKPTDMTKLPGIVDMFLDPAPATRM